MHQNPQEGASSSHHGTPITRGGTQGWKELEEAQQEEQSHEQTHGSVVNPQPQSFSVAPGKSAAGPARSPRAARPSHSTEQQHPARGMAARGLCSRFLTPQASYGGKVAMKHSGSARAVISSVVFFQSFLFFFPLPVFAQGIRSRSPCLQFTPLHSPTLNVNFLNYMGIKAVT